MNKYDEKVMDGVFDGLCEIAKMTPSEFLSSIGGRLNFIKNSGGLSNFFKTMAKTKEVAYEMLSFAECVSVIKENLSEGVKKVVLIKNSEFKKPKDFAEFKGLILATFMKENDEISFLIYFYHNKTDEVMKEKFGDKDMVVLQ